MIGPGVSRVITTSLEQAPFTKVVYSSDAFGSPELQWIAGKKGREALASCLGGAIDAGNLSPDAAKTAARLILADNTRLIYGISAGKSASKEATPTWPLTSPSPR